MVAATQLEQVRRFNRFYTNVIGVLDERHLESAFSPAEVRVLFELAHRDAPTAKALASDLRLDPGYLSRLLQRLARRRLVRRTRSSADGRESHLSLTRTGTTAVAGLEARASEDIAALLSPLDAGDRAELVKAMERIRELLGGPTAERRAPGFMLRAPASGDMGWIVQRHGQLYMREYGWDERFEALVAKIVAGFVENLDTKRERCWIAEVDGVNVGSVFVVRHPQREGVAQLRLLLVDPSARGRGIGRALVNECTRFARDAGYHTIMLWTNDVLLAARRIYQDAGYRLMTEERHESFGHDLNAQTWELTVR